MTLGILFLGVLAQIIGAFIVKDKMMYAGSLWLGVLLALAATYHMYRSLDRALDQPEKTAQKMIFRGYILRCDTDFYITGAYEDRGDESADLLFLLCDMYESNGVSTAAYP